MLDINDLLNNAIKNHKNKKLFYTIKTKSDFKRYRGKNNLIFENL